MRCDRCAAEGKEHHIERYFDLECDLCEDCFTRFASGRKTLRDEFAMAALNAFLACETFDIDRHTKEASKASYKIADAMLEARKAKGE